jgi:hypothetical protein
MYPSNGLVTVAVRGGNYSVVVSDDGGALSEVLSAGISNPFTDSQIKNIVGSHGLSVDEGVIFSPPVPIDEAPIAILLVANAAKQVAEWHYEHANIRVARDFKKALADVLAGLFRENLVHKVTIPGMHKPHTFANVINLGSGVRLIVDPVEREQSSIHARVIANLDVRQAGDEMIRQRIIYDDHEEWSPDDLGLLGMAEVPVIAFSRSAEAIVRMPEAGLQR